AVVHTPPPSTYFMTRGETSQPAVTLVDVLKQAKMTLEQLRGTGLGPIVRDLQRITDDLEVAHTDATLRTRMRRRAQRDLDELAVQESYLRPLADLLRQVPE